MKMIMVASYGIVKLFCKYLGDYNRYIRDLSDVSERLLLQISAWYTVSMIL